MLCEDNKNIHKLISLFFHPFFYNLIKITKLLKLIISTKRNSNLTKFFHFQDKQY